MQCNDCDLSAYLSLAPIPLAVERSLEWRILSRQPFRRPVLDIGCGDGLFAFMLFSEKVDVGIDLDARELQRARQLRIYGELIHCRGDAIPKPDGTFQTIFSNSVMEHIPDLRPVLKEALRVLAPGGDFYMTVPSDRFDQYTILNQTLSVLGLTGAAQAYRRWYDSFWKHYHFYSLEQWRTITTEAGFEVVDSFTYAGAKTCLFDDGMIPFTLLSFFIKRLANRWILFPRLRRPLLWPIMPLLKSMSHEGGRCEDGGLVFLSLRKPTAEVASA